ncbi:MAG: DUF3291 domain-containing protein [Betaproteobacteria bacterium]|nr:DUF3291 domain-containing protein [Betaproteobacteria bacterium]
MQFQLAQANIAYLRAPMDDPLLAGFVSRLDEINRLAEQSPGFVWRYISDSRDTTAREFDDPMVLFNMSVWRDIDSLHAYTYKTAHAQVFAQRATWFEDAMKAMGSRHVALWWIPAGTLPTAAVAKARLQHITQHGPSAFAFTFKQRFAADGQAIERAAAPATVQVPGE